MLSNYASHTTQFNGIFERHGDLRAPLRVPHDMVQTVNVSTTVSSNQCRKPTINSGIIAPNCQDLINNLIIFALTSHLVPTGESQIFTPLSF